MTFLVPYPSGSDNEKYLAQKENLLILVTGNQAALFSSPELAQRVKPKTWFSLYSELFSGFRAIAAL